MTSVVQLCLDHVAVEVSDLTRSIDYYAKLGFAETHRLQTGDRTHVFARLAHNAGGLQLTWDAARDDAAEPRWSGHVAYTVVSVDEALASLAAHGISPDRGPMNYPEVNARVAYLRDPDGYEIELVERLS